MLSHGKCARWYTTVPSAHALTLPLVCIHMPVSLRRYYPTRNADGSANMTERCENVGGYPQCLAFQVTASASTVGVASAAGLLVLLVLLVYRDKRDAKTLQSTRSGHQFLRLTKQVCNFLDSVACTHGRTHTHARAYGCVAVSPHHWRTFSPTTLDRTNNAVAATCS